MDTNTSYSLSILNTLTGELIEKDKDISFSSRHEGKSVKPAAICHSANAIVILYGPDGFPVSKLSIEKSLYWDRNYFRIPYNYFK